MPDGTFKRIENRMLFDNMSDYMQYKEDINHQAEVMGKDCPISPDLMSKYAKARASIIYTQDGYDMRIDDFTPRTYNPEKSSVSIKAQASSHIIKNKDGYTKDVTYREPNHYYNNLGTSHEHIQIHPLTDKYNLTEHAYSFENKDVKLNKISLEAPVVPNSEMSKLNGEYTEVNGKIIEATGSQSILFERKENQLTMHKNPNVEKVIEEFNRRKEAETTLDNNSDTFRFIIEGEGKNGIFVMNDEHGYGNSGSNLEQLKNIYGDVCRLTGINQNCNIYTAGSKNPSDMFFDRSSKQPLNDIQVETLIQANYSKNNNEKRNETLEPHKKHEVNINDER